MQRQRQQQRQPQYYYPIVQFPDPDRLVKLLELGNPSLFEGGSSNISGDSYGNDAVPKLSSASVTTTTEQNSDDRLSRLLDLGNVNFFGGSPMAEALAARRRGSR